VTPAEVVRFRTRTVFGVPHVPDGVGSSSNQIVSVPSKATETGFTILVASTEAVPPETGTALTAVSPLSDQYKFPFAKVSDAGEEPVALTTVARFEAAMI
jgi:hypothetical protein